MNPSEKFRRLVCTDAIRRDLRSKSVRAAGFTWVAGIADFVLRIGSTAVLARLILPQQFGLVMMVTAVTAVADQFRDLGLSTATVQRKEITHQQVTNLFWINVLAGIAIASMIAAVSPLVSAYYKEPRLTLITCILATNFVWGGLVVQHEALLARTLKLGHIATVRVLSSIISTVVAVVLAWKGFGYWALVWKEVVRWALLTAGMWICLPWLPGLPYRNAKVTDLIHFGAHLSAANILVSITAGADRFLLGKFWGAGAVALYRQAYQLLVVPMDQLLGPVFQVTQPGLSLLQTEDAKYRHFYQKVLTLVCIATMPVSLFVAVTAADITSVLLGPKWLECTDVLVILSLATFIKEPVAWSAHILITRGHSRRYLQLTVLQNVALIVFMLIGIRWGIRGVAAANLMATYLLAVPTTYLSLQGSPVTLRIFSATIARPAAASMIMALLVVLLHHSLPSIGAPAFLLLATVIAGGSFVSTWILLPGGKAELTGLVADVREAVQRKAAIAKSVEPVAVAS
jgi:O-antigen/teichoic acid export membrane protein